MNKLFLSIILGILLISIVSADFGNLLDNGLIGQYEFEEGSGNTIVNSYSGATANATMFNVNSSIWYNGFFGGGLNFYEGTTDKGINVSNNSLTTNQSITICMYVKIRYANSTYLYSDWNGGGLNLLIGTNSNGTIIVQSAGANSLISSNSIADNTWKHICYNRNFLLNNLSIWVDGVIVNSLITTANATVSTGPQYIFNQGVTLAGSVQPIGLLDHVAFWNRSLNSTEISTHGNQSFPSLTLINPTNNTLLNSNNLIVNLSLSGFNLSYYWKNITYSIWFSNGTLFNQTAFTGLSGNNTQVNKSFNNFIISDYIWNADACYGVSCYKGLTNYTFYKTSVLNAINYSSVVYETDYENILYNISVVSGVTPTNAKLFYNGTEYSMTITNTGGNNYTLSKLLSISSSMVGSNTFYITYNLSSTYKKTSSTYSQLVNPILFGWCNATLTVPYLNMSFKDETSEVVINTTIPTSTFYYWLGDSSLNKTFTYSNTTLNYNYPFCFIPQNKTLYLRPTIQYDNPSYEQRTYEPDTLTLTNATTNTTLYLLSTSDGIYVTFQVANLAGQTISGVTVVGTRVIGSTLTTVANGVTGSDGGITFWLNYHYLHTFTFTKDGYEAVTYSLTPTQSSYTVTMGSSSTVESSCTRGISELIYPNFDFLDNETEYDFNYTIDSNYWTLDSFGFNLYFQNGTLIGSDSSTTGTGGTVSVNNINLSTNQTYIYMNYYYTVNGSLCSNGSRTWYLQDNYGRSFSIWQFFTDFKSYIDSGNLWGFDEFGKILLSVILLIMIAGGASLRYGVRSDIFVAGIIFGVILMLDYGLGWFGTIRIGDNIAVNNLPTIVCAIAVIAIIIMEETR